ncbi:sigma-70 family RNA polymerase sigma factor [Streptomyces fulvoviolaceus]|uniref:sigma-70 family RNA polymerase sigma factor n=1 Tax=Streptomyces fulvoviolaceus TaxID=285535 RepID=UPI0021C1F7E9|nr:sigma-70 family RNA polymerase sigma factor [Streptomyces fulvoviolaceus]MCT9081473.1 sigma-70 family RNA polymerase sigma factor [Streptomyces fulvoviolaceus]
MTDGPITVPAQASATVAYTRIFEEQHPRLVAYARSLTRNSWAAEDLVAEAHFRVWRRLSAGHEIDNVPAYLMTTVRHLASAVGTAVRETPQDPSAPERVEVALHGADSGDDPAERASSVDLLARVLGQLPERWVQALWLAEAEGQSLEVVGQRIGAKQGATAVLLHRAREGMRQAFLSTQTDAPDDPACEVHWVRMPAYVRGSATARQSERLLGHVDACDDCSARLAVLMRANDKLPALVGPALLVFALGGAGKFLLPSLAGATGAVSAAGGGSAGTVAAGVKAPVAIAVGTAVTGAALAIVIALGSGGASVVPAAREPLTQGPAAGPSQGPVPGAGREVSVGSGETQEGDAVVFSAGSGSGAADSVVVAADNSDASTVSSVESGGGGSVDESTGSGDGGTAPEAGPDPAPEPADPAPVGPADPAPVGPADPAPVGPADPAPVGPADPAPVGPADPAPVEPADPAPAEPVEEEPEVPVQESPPSYETPETGAPSEVGETPASPAPSPTPEPETPTPVDPAPVEETPVATDPTPVAPETPAEPSPETPTPTEPPTTTEPTPDPSTPGHGCEG